MATIPEFPEEYLDTIPPSLHADQWGTDPTLRFTHPHDFRYALWLDAPDVLFEAAYGGRPIDALRQKQSQSLTKKERETLQKYDTNLAFAHTMRPRWDEWVRPLPTAEPCVWCGRWTTLQYFGSRDKPYRVGGNEFNNFHELRGPGVVPTLCPACGFMAESSCMGRVETAMIPPLNHGISIAWHESRWQAFAGSTPWYDLPLASATPALWCRFPHGTTESWLKKKWLAKTQPTIDPSCVAIWLGGGPYMVDATLLAPLQHALRALIAEYTHAPPLTESGQQAAQTLFAHRAAEIRYAVRQVLNAPPHHPLARWCWVPSFPTV